MGGSSAVRSSQINPFAGPEREIAALRTKKIFNCTTYAVLALSLAAMVVLLLISLSPTGWGWLLLLINLLTLCAAVAGIVMKKQPGCYSLVVVMSAISGVLQGISALALFTRTGGCLANLNPERINDYDGKALAKVYGALALVMFCLLWVLLALACVIQHCIFSEFYGEAEARRRASAKVQSVGYSNDFVSVQI